MLCDSLDKSVGNILTMGKFYIIRRVFRLNSTQLADWNAFFI
jgi:hypothetical protein